MVDGLFALIENEKLVLGLDQAARHREAHFAKADESDFHVVILRISDDVLTLRVGGSKSDVKRWGRPCAAHLKFLHHKRQILYRNFKWKAAQACVICWCP
ncbi:MAG: hypothetical protein WAN01_17855 [Bradyrhizobium sp.]